MKLRETYGENKIETDEKSLEILADDGRVLFTLDLNDDGSLEVHTASTVKHGGKFLDSALSVTAKGSNWFKLTRTDYK